MAERNGPTDGKRYKRVRASEEVKKNGRPCLLTPELQERICTLLRTGNYIETACRAVGIAKHTLYNWLGRGHKGEQPFVGFLHAIEAASADAEMINVGLILRAANKGQWQASAWWLERRFPKRFGRKIEISGDSENPLTVEHASLDLKKLTTEELRAMRAMRAKAAKDEIPE